MRRWFRWLFVALLLLVGALSTAANVPDNQHLVGKKVDIELRSGKTLRAVVLQEAAPGKIPGTIARLRVTDPASDSRPTLGASAIKRVLDADGAVLLAFDDASRCLAPPDPVALSAIHEAAAAMKQKKPAAPLKTTKSRPARSAKKSADRSVSSNGDAAAKRKQDEEKRLEFYKKTGVWLWPELTAEKQEKALTASRDFVRKVSETFSSLNMRLDETQYFLFVSDLPPQTARLFTSCLDEMYSQLCKAFAIKDRDRVWLGGKIPIIAFSRAENFVAFEQQFFKNESDLKNVQGLAHQRCNGVVVVSCCCGDDPYYFAGVLVHETTHGFVYRYKSSKRIPSWLNEGIAEWVAMNVVVRDQGIRRRVKDAVLRMRQTGNLGGDFFTADHLATGQASQYGIATAMVDYLLRANPKAFRAMFESIKLGERWQDALMNSYHVTPEQLTQQFGMTIGIPNLRP